MRMTNRDTNGFLVVLALLALSQLFSPALSVAADSEPYFIQHSQRRYFDLPHSARDVALGTSSVATSREVTSLFGNPAGLGWLEKYEMSLTFRLDQLSGRDFPMNSSIDDDLHTGTVQFAIPLKGGQWGVLGVGGSLYGSDIDDSVDTENDGYTLHLGYARRLGDRWSIGYALGYHRDEEEDTFAYTEMDDGLSNRMGVQYLATEKLIIGMSGFYGFATPTTEINILGRHGAKRKSWGLDFGAGWQVLEKVLVCASVDYVDYEVNGDVENLPLMIDESLDEDGESLGIHLGVEGTVTERLDLRLGYRYENTDYRFSNVFAQPLSDTINYHAVSTGLGFNVSEALELDLGVEYRFIEDGDMTPTATLKYQF